MSTVHIIDEDDLYSGYNEYHSALDTKNLEYDEVFQEAVRTSHAKRPIITPKPGTSMRLGTATRLGINSTRIGTSARPGTSSAMRLGTSSGYREGTPSGIRPMTMSQDETQRPMTAVRGAGFTSQRSGSAFDPLGQGSKTTPQFDAKRDDSPEEKIRQLERRITELIEESCIAAGNGDNKLALDRAKEASVKERSLIRTQETAGLRDAHNLDLTFAVLFNLANQYAASNMNQEALNTYQVITKNRMFSNANRLKVNMGNIYMKLGDFPRAVKMYRMALDQVPNTHKELRIKIMHNIGLLFVRMGQHEDAVASFQFIMQEKPDLTTGLHAVVCYFALSDKDGMKKGFQAMLEVPLNLDEDKYNLLNNDDPEMVLLLEVIKNDDLRKLERQMKQDAERSILMAAKLISPVIESSFDAGYDWCVDTLKASAFSYLAAELEINKAVTLLKQNQFTKAVETLKEFEREDHKLAGAATANLAFIHFARGELALAEQCAERSRAADAYSSAGYVALGSCAMQRGDLERARDLYACALDNDAACVEALYDLGLANKRLGLYDEALACFVKLQAIFRHQPQVLYQLASLCELAGDVEQASEWYHQLVGLIPSDPGLLRKVGNMLESAGDKTQAFQYNLDSYRHYPCQLDVLNWLGAHHVEMRVAEKAATFFTRAAQCQPDQVKWRLMVASCHRRAGDYHRAMACYKRVHRDFPENTECLKFLVRICSDLGLKEAADFAMELKKLERAKEVRERIGSGRPGTVSSHRSSGSGRSSRGDSGNDVRRGGQLQAQDSVESAASSSFVGHRREIEASYVDPLGPLAERPRTSAAHRHPQEIDEFADDEIGDDLLPM